MNHNPEVLDSACSASSEPDALKRELGELETGLHLTELHRAFHLQSQIIILQAEEICRLQQRLQCTAESRIRPAQGNAALRACFTGQVLGHEQRVQEAVCAHLQAEHRVALQITSAHEHHQVVILVYRMKSRLVVEDILQLFTTHKAFMSPRPDTTHEGHRFHKILGHIDSCHRPA
ncbi:hypothetical protein WJX72_000006 [[Myrmecia] bisecta]|uniref:Uncharacterized protein n=1 Tax=[Myrmecia] bisecta TaxID=41462 RepID=A0AAW1PZ51_9CHLO